MKKILAILFVSLFTLVSCKTKYERIGVFTSISTRNLDDSKEYILIRRDVQEITDVEEDPMTEAIDRIMTYYNGEFLRNVKVYASTNKKQQKFKIIGDVWGIPYVSDLKIGDKVVVKKSGLLGSKIVKGEVIGLNPNTVFVKDETGENLELLYNQVSKSK